MAMIKKTIVKGQKPTNEQLMELEAASKMPIIYDEDSPELTEEQYALGWQRLQETDEMPIRSL